MPTPFFFLRTVFFVHPRTAHSFLVVLPLGWAKGLRHYQLIALLGWPLLLRRNSTSPKFQGLEVLSLRDSLQSSTYKGTTRVTHATLRNSASVKSKEMKCCLYKTPYVTAPIQVLGDVIANSTPYAWLPTDASTRAIISFSWFTSDRFCKSSILSYQDSYMKFYKEIYKQRWYQKRTTYHVSWGVLQRVLQVSLQADYALTPHQEQKPQEPRRTRWPQEKGRWVISPYSCASHPLRF